jgi:hypothetical protein
MAGEIVVGIGGDGSGFEAARTAARVASLMHVPLILVFAYESSALGQRGGALEDGVIAIGEEAIRQIKEELLAARPQLTIEVELVAQRPPLLSNAKPKRLPLVTAGRGRCEAHSSAMSPMRLFIALPLPYWSFRMTKATPRHNVSYVSYVSYVRLLC